MIDSGHMEMAALLRQRDRRIEVLEARVKALEALCRRTARVLEEHSDHGGIKFRIIDDLEAAGRGEEVKP